MLGGMAYQDPGNVTVRNISVGAGSLTGTASQPLQVTGGGYFSGSVGIGTTAPGYLLDVGGAGQNAPTINCFGPAVDNNWGGGIRFASNNGTTVTSQIQASTNGLLFTYGGTERLRIDNSGQLEVGSLGTAAVPVFSFLNDPNTGIYSPGADQLALSTGGTGRLFVDGSGNVTVPAGGNLGINGAAPQSPLDVISNASSYGISLRGRSSDNISQFRFASNNHASIYSLFESGPTYLATHVNGSERLRIDSSGRLLVGTSTARANFFNASETTFFQVEGTGNTDASIIRNLDSTAGPNLILGKSRGSANGSNTLVGGGDQLGAVSFQGTDGSQFVEAARIQAFTDGTPGADDMPGRLVFSTTADGAASPTERMRISSSGNVGIGTANPASKLHVAGGIGLFSYNSGLTGATPGSYNSSNIEIYTTDNNTPTIGFHRAGVSATALYEYDGQLYVNAWIARAQTGLLLSSGNYNSYAPTLTGTGASGSWGISVTGSSASCTGNASTATTLQTTRTIWGQNFNGSANVSGALSGATTITASSDINLSGELNFSSANNKYIDFYTTNDVTSYTAYLRLVNDANNSFHQAIDMTRGGAVTLYHNNVAKFATTSGGVSVNGSINFSSSEIVGPSNLNLTTDTTQQYYFGLSRNGQLAARFNGMKVYNTAGGPSGVPASKIGFFTDITNSVGSTERLTITEVGNVGIGTTLPSVLLDVASAANSNAFRTQVGGTTFFSVANNSAGAIVDFFDNAGTLRNRVDARAGFASFFTAGNVGIGTNAPQTPLQVVGAVESRSANTYRGIRLEAGEGGFQAVKAHNYLGAGYDSQILFKTMSGVSVTDAMVINGQGNVGLGTLSPLYPLHIDKAQEDLLALVNTGVSTYRFQVKSDASLAIVQNSTERMRITSNGSVGIGTNAPVDSFVLYGDGRRSVQRASTTSGESTVEAQVSTYWSTPTYTGTALVQNGAATAGTKAGITAANLGELRFQNGSAGLIYTNSGVPLIFATTSAERMRITSAGNVGIGTTNPTSKLSVVGDISGTTLTSTVATGTAPLTVTSTTLVSNLNSQYLGGQLGSYYLNTDTTSQSKTGKLWASYGRTAMGGYSWVDAAFTTNSIEIVNDVNAVTTSSPTLSFHRYGTGGPQFRLDATGTNVLYLESANANSARSPTAQGSVYFASLNLTSSDANGIYVNSNKVWHQGNDGAGSGLDADLLDGVDSITRSASHRANRNISGGGTITVDASYNVLWSARFIIISNGSGSNFSTDGYFEITCPVSGTITGVGGASNVTATAAGIPLGAWQAIYYILPIGSSNGSLPANFRVAQYTSTLDIPHNWVLICVRNSDTGVVTFNNGITLSGGQSLNSIQQATTNTANTLVRRDGSGNFSAGTITAGAFSGPLTGNVTGNVSGSSGSCTGNAATATTLSTNNSNYFGVTNGAVVGQMMWKNYANNHTIFDASASTSPSGVSVNNTNSAVAWAATYPTLMGWNGASTYGVRVDSARISDSTSGSSTSCTGNAATSTTLLNARLIGGTSFNGSADITPFRSSTLTTIDGGTIQSSVTTYSARSASSTPQQYNYGVNWEFKGAAVVGGAGNYAGLMTLAPWHGTTSSTGDPNYQLAFSPAAVNSTAVPTLQIRAGIDATWGSWATILNSSNYTSYVGNGTLTLAVSGTGLSGSASFTANQSGNTTFTVTSNATNANTVSTIVARDASGNFSAGAITATNYLVTTASSTQASGATIQRVFTKSVAAGELYQLATYNDIEGTVAFEIQVSSQQGGHSGTSTYRFQGGFSALSGSYYRLYPFNDGRGHGDSADTGLDSNAWNVFIYGTTVTGSQYTYGIAVHVPTGRTGKSLITTITELKRGMTFSDQSANAAITSFTNSGNIYSHRNLIVESRIGVGKVPTTAIDVNGTVTATSFSGSGASLTSLNASNLDSGTVPVLRLGSSGTRDNTTYLRGDNTWATISAGSSITVSDDTSTNATRYLVFEDVTSGASTSINVSSTKLTFNPSTGTLSTTVLSSSSDASVNGLRVGKGAGSVNTNAAFGSQALLFNSTGSNNTANGYKALNANTTGGQNTATGSQALNNNTIGNYNTAYGQAAMLFNTTGNQNTATGASALNTNTTGSENTASGYNALLNNTTASGNTAVGSNALRATTTGGNNTATGNQALYNNTTGINNTAYGVNALTSNTTGQINTATGRNALNSNTTGTDNTANGYQALQSSTTGIQNTADGVQALYSNTTGNSNTAVGLRSLYSNTTGFGNVATGRLALAFNTTGIYNTGNGYGALQYNTTGSNNTAVGFQAGQPNTWGSNNTFLGYNAVNTAGGVTASNTIVLGNSSVTTLRCQTATISALSDARDKKDVINIPLGLDFLNDLRPVKFTWDQRDRGRVDLPDSGFIAQEALEAVMWYNADWLGLVDHQNPDRFELSPAKLIPVLVKAIQELSQQNQEFRAQLDGIVKKT